MSANKKKENTSTELTGKVVLKKFGQGSKSQHDAVCLQTSKAEYVLRRVGGNPFHDAELHRMVGKEVTVMGMIEDYIFFAKTIKELS